MPGRMSDYDLYMDRVQASGSDVRDASRRKPMPEHEVRPDVPEPAPRSQIDGADDTGFRYDETGRLLVPVGEDGRLALDGVPRNVREVIEQALTSPER